MAVFLSVLDLASFFFFFFFFAAPLLADDMGLDVVVVDDVVVTAADAVDVTTSDTRDRSRTPVAFSAATYFLDPVLNASSTSLVTFF